MKKIIAAITLAAALGSAAAAATVVRTSGEGASKLTVAINIGDGEFARSLKRNLELTGVFAVRPDGTVKVSGAAGKAITATGAGKSLKLSSTATDERSARMEARRLADAMTEAYSGQKGFACDPIVMVRKTAKDTSELCTAYPDGRDVVQLTADGKSIVGPRWANRNTIFYTGIYNAGPEVFEYNLAERRRYRKWQFKGLATGATASPDGRRVAIILSIHGNPELYVIDLVGGTLTRLTTTPNASEGQPSWSPDGSQIVYVSDETRQQQLYIIDVATKHKRRLTSGKQNVDPDWGKDGRITYVTKRGGRTLVAVVDPARGEKSGYVLEDSSDWEHPSWSRDGRHLVANKGGEIWVLDAIEDESKRDKPTRLFSASGTWINPSWSK